MKLRQKTGIMGVSFFVVAYGSAIIVIDKSMETVTQFFNLGHCRKRIYRDAQDCIRIQNGFFVP
jgi:hypothetical protein